MRKIISILFLLILFGSQVGRYLYYSFQQHQIRAEMKRQLVANLPDSSLELIVENQNNTFRWEEEGKEFYQNGQMYDVVKSTVKDGRTILYCINDKKEEDLLARIQKTTNPERKKSALQILKSQILDSLVQSIKVTANTNPVPLQKYYSFNAAIAVQCKEVYAPPPRA